MNFPSLFCTPWKIFNEIRRVMALPFIRLYFTLNGIKWGSEWYIYGFPILQRHIQSTIIIGDHFSMRNFYSSNPLSPSRPGILSTRKKGANIKIGNKVGMTGGTICAAESITIGDRVLIGANSFIIDTDFHPLDMSMRSKFPQAGSTSAIQIEDDVFIGMNSIILKGVHIGRGAVIGAGSVVTHDIPPNVICAGNPAKVIRNLQN